MATKFLKQSDKPLFPNLLWNRPVSARQAGRLLLVGGQPGNFSVPNDIFLTAEAAGIGQSQIAFPDSLQKTLSGAGIGIFVPSNPAGSLGKNSVAAILETAHDFDAVGIGGNLGNNSQTTVALEALLAQLQLPVALYDDALELLRFAPSLITQPTSRLVILTMAELFKLAGRCKIALPQIKDGVTAKVDAVRALAGRTQANYLVFGKELIVASEGQVSLTNLGYVPEPAVIYAAGTVWWLQNQKRPFQGLTTAAFILSQFDDRGVYTVSQAVKKIRHILDQY